MIIDAWMQHFGESQLIHPMFASLRRWTRQSFAPVTPEMTIAAMDEGRVSMGLAAAWCRPEEPDDLQTTRSPRSCKLTPIAYSVRQARTY